MSSYSSQSPPPTTDFCSSGKYAVAFPEKQACPEERVKQISLYVVQSPLSRASPRAWEFSGGSLQMSVLGGSLPFLLSLNHRRPDREAGVCHTLLLQFPSRNMMGNFSDNTKCKHSEYNLFFQVQIIIVLQAFLQTYGSKSQVETQIFDYV